MEYKTLGEICDVVSGGTPSRSKQEYWNGDIPWIKIGNIKSKYVSEADEFITEAGLSGSSAKMLKKGTILYTIFATLGEAGVLTIDACTNQAIVGISIKDESVIDRDYLFYYLKSKKNYVNEVGRGVAQNNINMSILRGFEVPIRKLYEQQEITRILDKTASIIEDRKKELDKLDYLIKARFVELFGDVICNEKRWPAYALSDISESRLGKMLDAKQQTGENQHPYLANFNVQWFRFDFSQLNEMDFNEADRKEFELQEGDLLVTEGGEVGRCAVWKNEIPFCYFQKALHRVRCDKQIVLPEYLAWWFKQHADYNSFEDVVGGKTSIPHLTGVKLKNLMVVVPDMALQRQFLDFSKQVDKSKVAVQKALDEAQLLFDGLMQEYFG